MVDVADASLLAVDFGSDHEPPVNVGVASLLVAVDGVHANPTVSIGIGMNSSINTDTMVVLSFDDRTRMDHVEALARRGSESVASLLELLVDPSWAVRRAIIAVLSALGDDAVDGLCDVLLYKRDHEGRLAACVGALVGSVSTERVDTKMIELATAHTGTRDKEDDDNEAKTESSSAVAKKTKDLGPHVPRVPILCDAIEILGRRRVRRAVPLLASLSTHVDDNVAARAIEALGRVGGIDTVDALVSAVELRHFFRTFPAIDPLGRTGDERAIHPLSKLLADPLYGPEAARALGRTGHKSAVAPLASLLLASKNADPDAATAAVPIPATSTPSGNGNPGGGGGDGGGDGGGHANSAHRKSLAMATVRIAALALADLLERYEGRYGDTKSIREALRQSLAAKCSQRGPKHASKDEEDDEPTRSNKQKENHDEKKNHAAGADVDDVAAVGVASTRLIESLIGVTAPLELAAMTRVLGWLGNESAIRQLVEMVTQEPPVGLAAAVALRRLGANATPQLLVAIRDGDCTRRLRLLPIVGQAALKGSIDQLLTCLEDVDGDVRVRACDALGRLGNPVAVTALFQLIGDRNARVSQAAAAAIQSLGSHDTKRLALEHARSTDRRTRRTALRIISYFGYPEGLDVLIDAMQDDDDRIREAAIYGLPFIDDPRATEALLAAAVVVDTSDDDPTRNGSATATPGATAASSASSSLLAISAHTRTRMTRMRSAVMRALGQTSTSHPSHPRVVDMLRASLADADPWTRYYACQALGRLKVTAACPSIVELIHDPSGQVRVAAVEALAHLRTELIAQQALAHCAESSEDADMRRAALLGLGIARRPESIPLLQRAATAQDSATRLVAIGALAELDGSEVITTLAHAAASDPDEAVRSAAIGYLSTRPSADATTALVAQLLLTTCETHNNSTESASNNAFMRRERERERVLEALVVSADDRIDGILEALASVGNPENAQLLVSALTHMRRPRSEAAIRACLGVVDHDDAQDHDDQDHEVLLGVEGMKAVNNVHARRAAAAALAALGTAEARDALRHAGRVDPDADVRHISAAGAKEG